jgi:site-specific DNA recombinase
VRYIFARYGKGNCGMNQISRKLEEMGALTKTGKNFWTYSKLHSILCNPTYAGVKYFNKTQTIREYGNPATGTSSSRKYASRQREEWVGVRVPAIISQALFDRVQERLDRNRQHYRNPRQVQLLSALLRCGECGYGFFAYQRHYTDRRERRPRKVYHRVAYRCSRRAQRVQHSSNTPVRRCNTKEIKAQFLEDQVFTLISAFMFNPDKIRKCMDLFKDKIKTAQLRLEQELKRIEGRIQALGEQKKRIIEVYALGDLSKDDYTRKSLGYDNDILKLKQRRSDVLKRIPLLHKTGIIDESIRQYCERAKAQFQGCLDFATKRQFLLDFVERWRSPMTGLRYMVLWP